MERKDLPSIGIEILQFVEKNKDLKDFKQIAHDFIDIKALDDLSELKKLEDVIFYELGDEELENKIYSSNIKGMILTKAGVIESEPVMRRDGSILVNAF